MYRGKYNVAGRLAVELLNAFTQIRFDYPDSAVLEKCGHAALLLEHRFALDQFFHAMILKDAVHDLVVFGGISSPMNVRAAFRRIILEFLKVLVQMCQRVFLDRGG